MSDLNIIDKSREILRELQTMLFDEEMDNKTIFQKTLELDNKLNQASIDYNKYLNDIEK